jgi:hypothetical protein
MYESFSGGVVGGVGSHAVYGDLGLVMAKVWCCGIRALFCLLWQLKLWGFGVLCVLVVIMMRWCGVGLRWEVWSETRCMEREGSWLPMYEDGRVER